MGAKYEITTLVTPQRNILFALWSAPLKPKRAIIFIHGLGSSSFTLEKVVSPLRDKSTAVLKFNNRGFGTVNKLNKIDRRKQKGYKLSKVAGAAHEIFNECVDDIQGAVDFVKRYGINEIFLVGHSTGCQKSIYFLSKKNKQKQIKGAVLLCPVSDYSAVLATSDKKTLTQATKLAHSLVSKSKLHTLIPQEVWKDDVVDAQRFLSLYTPDSEEEIFTYSQENKKPTTFKKVKIPILAVFAEKDEYHDRPTEKITGWFENNSKSKDLTIKIVENSPHSFQGNEVETVQAIKSWLNNTFY
jgi:alpha-beta hydrolase superfamily lysophospholipase